MQAVGIYGTSVSWWDFGISGSKTRQAFGGCFVFKYLEAIIKKKKYRVTDRHQNGCAECLSGGIQLLFSQVCHTESSNRVYFEELHLLDVSGACLAQQGEVVGIWIASFSSCVRSSLCAHQGTASAAVVLLSQAVQVLLLVGVQLSGYSLNCQFCEYTSEAFSLAGANC